MPQTAIDQFLSAVCSWAAFFNLAFDPSATQFLEDGLVDRARRDAHVPQVLRRQV
jgi:hypothetical protein